MFAYLLLMCDVTRKPYQSVIFVRENKSQAHTQGDCARTSDGEVSNGLHGLVHQ